MSAERTHEAPAGAADAAGVAAAASIAADAARTWHVAADHPAFDGHFPGQPILPGVALLAAVLEAVRADAGLARFVGAAPHFPVAKFIAPVRPGATVDIAFEHGPRSLAWTVRDGQRIVASGQLASAEANAASSSLTSSSP